MKFAKEYFDLQIKFCEKVLEITGRDFLEILPLYSDFTKRFGIPNRRGDISEDFQQYNGGPEWKDFCSNYYNPKDKLGSCYEYYLMRGWEPKKKDSFFRYDIEGGDVLRIHTNMNSRENEYSPLSINNIEKRKEELGNIILEIKEKFPQVKFVRGHSWLYNIEAYKRLFPKSYLDSAVETRFTIQGLALWGQFLDKNWSVKKDLMDSFLDKVEKAKTIDELWEAFPFIPLEVKAPIKKFFEFFNCA